MYILHIYNAWTSAVSATAFYMFAALLFVNRGWELVRVVVLGRRRGRGAKDNDSMRGFTYPPPFSLPRFLCKSNGFI